VIPEHEILPYEVSPLPPGPWLVLAPHADDETIGMGGSLARAAAEGIDTRVAIMTDGALGGSQPGLVETRRQEARRACACLGVRRLHFLDEPDRGLRLNPELIEKISQLIIASGAKSVFFPGVMEPHPDHRMTSELAWRALAGSRGKALPIAYEITVQSPVNRLVDISAWAGHKREALDVYGSQLGENNYAEIVQALNVARTFTLPAGVRQAEGFWQYDPEAPRQGKRLSGLAATFLDRLFQI